ncbi:MAG: HAD family phosphatase [Prevotellaceae bacterium]|jgi:HAD superfamily hydrolase (TIGR01509 family)|nr:HAD family phosphatase [Prevotellaceae bacterium]
MNTTFQDIALLFDLDGVVIDTESQYSTFWHQAGVDYLGTTDLEQRIKGQTLTYIYDTFFPGMTAEQHAVTAALDRFERGMTFDYLPGVETFLSDLMRHHVKCAVVTSSNEQKMNAVYKAHPELSQYFTRILTAELFARSKPAPDCFLLGMKLLGTTPQHTYVFEDSINGLKAGMASGATVIGLATTNPREAVAPLSHYVMDDFTGLTADKLIERYTFAASN